MSQESISPDQQPSFDFAFNATPEQRKALQIFLDFVRSAETDNIDELVHRGMELYDRNPDLVVQTADYLEECPGGFAVLSIWHDIGRTRADQAALFDEETESAIDADPENQKLLANFQKSKSEPDRLALRRRRFRLLAKRAAKVA